jgi:uncharacterized protein YcbK (DUF882 family)
MTDKEGAQLAFVARNTFVAQKGRRRLASLVGVAVYALLHAPASTQPAVADGDTRTLTFVDHHTNESGSFTYRVSGRYDQQALDKLNWFMRDWRLNEQTKMDPHLFDILWDVYQQSGSSQPIDVLSGYRSPQTNAMLRRRSRLVASKSQHMQGKAIDAHFIDVGPARIRDVAMRMQEGGVGFYPIGSTPWVHIDSGTVRYWPRMSRNALARLFPDGKTVFIPADGKPMDGYADAKAMIEARGGDVQTASSGGGLLGWLFGGARGGGEDDAEDSGGAPILATTGRGGLSVVTTAGRGGASAPVVVAAAPVEPAAPPAEAAPPAAAEAAPSQEATALAPQDAPVAEGAATPAQPADALAPLPPRKPLALLADLDPIAPVPPKRPLELAPAPSQRRGPSPADDLIARLMKDPSLPADDTPKSALSLVEPAPRRRGNADALARAAALTPPPLPPSRPRLGGEGVTQVEKGVPLPPARPAKAARSSASNPFGSLVVDAFNAPDAPAPAKAAPDLRGSTP